MSLRTSMVFWGTALICLLGLVVNPGVAVASDATEGFETDDFSKFPWSSSGDASWVTARFQGHSGRYCAKSGSIGDGQSTTLQVTLNCSPGRIAFYRKVSSEPSYDYLKFYIDGEQKGEWSGQEDWAEVAFTVDGGTRTFAWTYSKDGSNSAGDDAAWLDDIVFPVEGTASPAKSPFKRGVNLTNWLQTSNAGQIQFTKFSKQDLIDIKSLGCDVIRLPINLHAMAGSGPDYTIDPLFYYFLDQIVGWAEELELHLILDNHTFDPAANTSTRIGDTLVPVWAQMAQHYKDRSNYLYYEVLNEPHGIPDATWNQIQQRVIDAIRAVDQKHTIIVGPAGWNSYNNLRLMPAYQDTNLIYTFHFYDPFMFTHQGASWVNPSMVPLAGVPFPYDATLMPQCPPELRGTWVDSSLANYKNDGTVQRVRQLIDIAAAFQAQRQVPLFCGEFGVFIPNSDNEDRIFWYNIVRSYLEQKGIAWTIWDYKGGFGLFEKGSSELFDYDLNVPLVETLGLVAPPQQEFTSTPDVNGFDLYLDYIGPNIVESSWINEGLLDYYSQDNPASGSFCIHWTGVNQYSAMSFRFSPIKDLSVLANTGFALDLWVRCSQPGARFDVRFVDTKTGERGDHPWRRRYTISQSTAVWDGQWNHLQIPLRSFTEHGAWDNGWFNPIGAFDWSAIDRFEIVPEYGNLQGIHLYFDDIRVLDPNPRRQP